MKKKKIAKYMQATETPMTPKALYDKVTWGDSLNEAEKTFLQKVLEDASHTESGGLGTAIEAFALSHPATQENVSLVEKFLDESFHYGIFVQDALKALCYDYYWNLSKKYLPLLKNILLRREVDSDLFSRAASALGMYLSNNKDEDTFHFIHDLFLQVLGEYIPRCPWEIKYKVHDLYQALRYASSPHEKRGDIYFEIEKMKFPEDVDDELLKKYLE